ncbi:hypothetical protein J27TS7_56080 [Paenibacillus dendritiformis]|uniref:hypothetical protein n=1 Tax=Paenibacillus dendritiformis TaxID=130049 RepID=UPI001B0E5F54|nr:hypothetical protein [Paenibacillus dendritiformis]GIO76094.1 hypothetical protein J27TS7_56080 [Paenibacillus dendritiformis]
MRPDIESLFEMLHGDKPRLWLFTGDSITHGPLHTNGMRNYVEHIQERIRWELQRFHDIVIGRNTRGSLKCALTGNQKSLLPGLAARSAAAE